MTADLTSPRTREQEAADRIIRAWTHLITDAAGGKVGHARAAEVVEITRAECARLADAIRGFVREGK